MLLTHSSVDFENANALGGDACDACDACEACDACDTCAACDTYDACDAFLKLVNH
jgi:hypothetical protein